MTQTTNHDEITIARDALLEGKIPEAAAIAAAAKPDVFAACTALLAAVQAELTAKFPTLDHPVRVGSIGRRFIRLHVNGSTWAWVEKSNGLVWATNGQKPQTNYPRGCVFDADSCKTLAKRCFGIAGSPAYHAELR